MKQGSKGIKVSSTSHQKQIGRLRKSIEPFLSQQNSSSLFEKLQAYDKAVGQLKLVRTNQEVLLIFQELIKSEAQTKNDSKMIKSQHENKLIRKNHLPFSSPTNQKKQLKDVEDPQLFSFSKTRKLSDNQQQSTHRYNKNGLQWKRIQGKDHNSDKAKSGWVQLTSPNAEIVSQFNHERIEGRDQPTSILQKVKKVKLFLQRNSLSVWVSCVNAAIRKRKSDFKLKTSIYVHQIHLLRKGLLSFQKWTQMESNLIKQFTNNKERSIIKQIFMGWHEYASRPESVRVREKESKQKALYIMKLVSVRKFIRNRQMQSGQKQILKQQTRNKQFAIRKILFMRALINANSSKKILFQNVTTLTRQLKLNQIIEFVKMLRCFSQSCRMKQQRQMMIVFNKINGIRFINHLKKEYYFQRAYWQPVNCLQNTTKIQRPGRLDTRYQKIVFIYQFFDCIQHNLQRKGYKFLQSEIADGETTTFDKIVQNHPAYQNYYRPFKLNKYFNALKKQPAAIKINTNAVKYGIVGKRVFKEGLLSWYGSKLRTKINRQHIESKTNVLNNQFKIKLTFQFFKTLQKNTTFEVKLERLNTFIVESRAITSLRIMKSFTFAKGYYRNVILQSKLKRQYNILEEFFLQWKLYCAEIVHNKLLEKDIKQLRKKFAIKNMLKNLQEHWFPNKIANKKILSLKKSIFNNSGDRFIQCLRMAWLVGKNCKSSTSQLSLKSKNTTDQIVKLRKIKFIEQIQQFWFQQKYTKEIQNKIDQQYERKLLHKSFAGLIACQSVEKKQKLTANQIIKISNTVKKRRIMKVMIDRLIENLILKRTCSIIKAFWLRSFIQCLQNKNQKQKHKEEKELYSQGIERRR